MGANNHLKKLDTSSSVEMEPGRKLVQLTGRTLKNTKELEGEIHYWEKNKLQCHSQNGPLLNNPTKIGLKNY